MKTWLQKTSEGYILKLQVVPNSSRNQVVGEHGDRLRIKISSPPVDGKANEQIISFLAQTLDLRSAQLQLIRGQTSKAKDVLVVNVDESVFSKLLD